jgi:nitric oxide reductase activation protein
MTFDSNNLCQNCLDAQARSGIDLRRLLSDLSKIKQEFYPQTRSLSDTEIQYLCLSLSRYSQGQIAYYLYRHKIPDSEELINCEDLQRLTKNLNSEMSSRIHKYLKKLMSIDLDARKPSWKKVLEFLQQSDRYYLAERPSRIATKLSVLIEIESSQSFDLDSIKQLNELLKRHGIENIKISKFI